MTATPDRATMRAVVFERYGPLDGLELREIPCPTPDVDQVLVRVARASVHPGDLLTIRGEPLPVRAFTGWLRPKMPVPGFDLAGTVEAVGAKVTRFAPGDAVVGAATGTAAEFAVADEDGLVRRPEALDPDLAVALPTSGLAALHGLRDAAQVQSGQHVLINGAAGGIGHFAVQLAKEMGATVTAVCGPANVEFVRELGAHHVIDYTREDFTRGEARYDLVFDNVENQRVAAIRRVLTPDGTLLLNSGTGADGTSMLWRMIAPLLLSPFVRHSLKRYVSEANPEDLASLVDRVTAGTLRPHVGATFTLDETRAALEHVATGHARGKTVVRVG